MSNWIPIFKTGSHTDSAGNTRIWTEQELDTIVQKYNPMDHEAPVVIGHPESNSPAWGWVESLKRDGQLLYAKYKDMVPEFVDMVRKGLFKKRSISLYPDMTLRHVGYLGATPPAVKGLPDVAFNDLGGMTMIMDFSASAADKKAQEARSRKYGISVRDDGNVTKPAQWANVPDDEWLDPVNYAYPCPNADQTRAAAAYWGKADNKAKYSKEDQAAMDKRLAMMEKKFKMGMADQTAANHNQYFPKEGGKSMKWFEWMQKKAQDEGVTLEEFSDPGSRGTVPVPSLVDIKSQVDAEVAKQMREKELAFAEAQKTKEAELKAREEALKKAEGDRQKAEIASFCEGLCEKGKLTPAMMKFGMGLTNFLESIADIGTQYEFVETSPSGRLKQTPLEFMKLFFSSFKKQIEFGEVAGNGNDIGKDADKREAMIKNYMEKNEDATYKEAVLAISKEHPELFKE